MNELILALLSIIAVELGLVVLCMGLFFTILMITMVKPSKSGLEALAPFLVPTQTPAPKAPNGNGDKGTGQYV